MFKYLEYNEHTFHLNDFDLR